MHTDSSVATFENVTSALGVHLRHFAYITCPAFKTRESKREYQARLRTTSKRSGATAVPASVSADPDVGRRSCTYNLKTVKTHLVGYWPSSVKYIGSLDSTSTWAVRIPASSQYHSSDTISYRVSWPIGISKPATHAPTFAMPRRRLSRLISCRTVFA